MTPENVKILTLAATIGFSVAVTTILFRYFSKDNTLQSFDSSSNNNNKATTTTTTTTPTSTNNNNNNNNNTNVVVKQTNERPTEPILDIEELIAKCGFCRPEMTDVNRESPNNSISTYQRHFFICTGISSEEWPAKLYSATPLLTSFSEVMKKYENNERNPAIINATDIPSKSNDTLDLIVFPEMVKLIGLTSDSLELVLQHFRDNDTIELDSFPSNVSIEQLNGKFIFICTHKQKDKRCGYCGPILVDQLRDEIKSRGLSSDIQVFGTSHVGGHKYAGNVLVFPPGNWYGYVTPEDVKDVIDSTLSGDIIKKLHRGTMGEEIIKPEKKDKHEKRDKHENKRS